MQSPEGLEDTPFKFTTLFQAGLAASSLNLDANELADEIMIQITPFVSSSLEQEAQKASALSEDQVVQIIITDLKPTGIYQLYTFLKSPI